ncbi:MAG: glycosyltransferase [Bacteroidales bacterium]|nr:glycosyltransferase [Candidatus Colicola coprequi]
MRVLYLSAWYPTERDQMAGLFVQKHADAVRAQGADVRVVYTEEKGWRYWRKMIRGLRTLRKEGWLPDVVQVNVLNKNGLLAWWLWKRYRIPYIIIEHWSGYLPANFSFRGGWHGWLMRSIAQEAKCILPVSQMLEDAMKNCGIHNSRWERIHNVVDDFFYQLPVNRRPTVDRLSTDCRVKNVRLLHVSCFDEKAKNTQGLLRAYKHALASRPNLHLTMVGTGVDWQASKDYAAQIGLTDEQVRWTGELTPREVCHEMQQADGFVLFSNYETYAIVLVEALISGLPIISSQVGIAPEVVTDDKGIVVPVGDEQALTQAIIDFQADQYSPENLRQNSEQYRFSAVGKQLMTIYSYAIQY